MDIGRKITEKRKRRQPLSLREKVDVLESVKDGRWGHLLVERAMTPARFYTLSKALIHAGLDTTPGFLCQWDMAREPGISQSGEFVCHCGTLSASLRPYTSSSARLFSTRRSTCTPSPQAKLQIQVGLRSCSMAPAFRNAR